MTTRSQQHQRSIAQVNRMVRSIIEAETLEHFFWVGGKIERFYRSDRGHVYFDLVDDRSRINCMLREERTGNIPFDLKNYLDVEVYGDVQFYEEQSRVQINVLDARLTDKTADGRPVIERLRRENLYPPTKKVPPANIRRIGIITSQSSRAIGDFEDTYRRAGERGVLAPLLWKYVTLEGARAVQSIVDTIAALDKLPDIDVIAVIRGGGRYENLAVFHEFDIVRALILCNTFVVTGIGHYKDVTLTDEVADHTAATPTAAAQYIADLCLRPLPSTAADKPIRWAGKTAVAAKSRAYPQPAYAKRSAPETERSSRPNAQLSNRMYRLIVAALILIAIASVSFLLAVMVWKAQ